MGKAIDRGAQAAVCFLGEGISARFPFGQYDSEEFRQQSATRMEGAKMALRYLGISDITFNVERKACQFDTLPLITIVKEIESHIERFQPTILFMHHASDVNIDHGITYKAVETACRATGKFNPKEIYTFEIVCSSHWGFESTFKPNTFVDISDYWEKKLNAWHRYTGENKAYPFPRSDTGLETLSQFRGMAVGLRKAEAFQLVRKIV